MKWLLEPDEIKKTPAAREKESGIWHLSPSEERQIVSNIAAKQLQQAFYRLDKEFWKAKINGLPTLCMTEGKWIEILREIEAECAPFVK